MTVYVDALREWGWRLGPSAHLIADTPEELHAFAARLGMRRSWAQRSRSGVVHYDLVRSRRERAVALGAETDPEKFFTALARLKEKKS